MSYLGQFDYNGDRYGLKTERLVVGDGFDPGIGFLRRRDFQRNYAEARFSPRPHSIPWLRKIGWTGSVDYTTDNESDPRDPDFLAADAGRNGKQRPAEPRRPPATGRF